MVKKVVVYADTFSGYCHLVPLINESVPEIMRAFKSIWACIPPPERILLDNATYFIALKQMRPKLSEKLVHRELDMHFVTPYLHRSNPAERLNRSILERMKTECLYDGEFRKKSWLDVVSDCQSWLNNSVKQVEKVSAMEIHFHPSKISDKRSVVEEHHLKYLKETVGEKYE